MLWNKLMSIYCEIYLRKMAENTFNENWEVGTCNVLYLKSVILSLDMLSLQSIKKFKRSVNKALQIT